MPVARPANRQGRRKSRDASLGRRSAHILRLALRRSTTQQPIRSNQAGSRRIDDFSGLEPSVLVRTAPLVMDEVQTQQEAAWIEGNRQLWGARFDELDKVVEELKLKEKADGRKKRK